MVLMLVRQGVWTEWVVAKDSQGKAEKHLRQARGQLNGQTDSPTGRDNLLFFQGLWKKVRFVADGNDEVRTTVSHISVWQQVSTEEPCVWIYKETWPSTQGMGGGWGGMFSHHISHVKYGGRRVIDNQCKIIDGRNLDFRSQPDLHAVIWSNWASNYFVSGGNEIKADFVHTNDTIRQFL